jgi:hypothetical protein
MYRADNPLLIDWNSIIDNKVELLVVLYPICKLGISSEKWVLILRDLKEVFDRAEPELWSTIDEIATINWIVMREEETGMTQKRWKLSEQRSTIRFANGNEDGINC